MCTLESRIMSSTSDPHRPSSVDGRHVLQPNCNRVPTTLERRNSLKQFTPKTPPPVPPPPTPRDAKTKVTTAGSPTSPKPRSPRPPAVKRGSENNGLTSSADRISIPKSTLTRSVSTLERKKSKKWGSVDNVSGANNNSSGIEGLNTLMLGYSSSLITESPGSFAAIRREQMAIQHAQRKMRTAHYGRSRSAKFASEVSPLIESLGSINTAETTVLERRCTSVTPNSDPLYVAYHDEEWGVPVHDDRLLFELLVLSGTQVGSDWASILRKRQDFRDAFSGFDSEIVANLTEKQLTSVSTQYAIEIRRVRGVVDNAKRILEIKKEFGSFDNYIWGFVNGKPISPQYKFAHKIPVKTSKSESISKDMVRRGFRTAGPSAIHSFMQAVGLTNDHLISCYRHLQCTALASRRAN